MPTKHECSISLQVEQLVLKWAQKGTILKLKTQKCSVFKYILYLCIYFQSKLKHFSRFRASFNFFLLWWITKTLRASASGSALLTNFRTLCGPQVKTYPTPGLGSGFIHLWSELIPSASRTPSAQSLTIDYGLISCTSFVSQLNLCLHSDKITDLCSDMVFL